MRTPENLYTTPIGTVLDGHTPVLEEDGTRTWQPVDNRTVTIADVAGLQDALNESTDIANTSGTLPAARVTGLPPADTPNEVVAKIAVADDAAAIAAARGNLGLGTAATKDTGTAIGNVVELVDVGGNPGLPAIDISQATGVASYDQDLNTTDDVEFQTIKVTSAITGTDVYNSPVLAGLRVSGTYINPFSGNIGMSSGTQLMWGSSPSLPPINNNGDVRLNRGGPNILDLRNGTNAQTYRLAKTYTSATNFESLELKATSTGYQIGSTVGSAGGSNQPVSIGHTDAAGNFTAGLTVENGEGVLLENGIQLRRLIGGANTVIEHHTSNNLNVNAIGGGHVNFGNTSGGTFVNFSANGITAERGDVNLSGVNSGVHFATLGTSVDVQTARFRLKPLANQNLGFGSRGGFEFWTGGGVNGSTGTKTFEIDSDGKTNCGGGLSLAPITTAALLAITPAVDAGNFRVTDSTPPNQGVYPDGTNWRYYDNTIVS